MHEAFALLTELGAGGGVLLEYLTEYYRLGFKPLAALLLPRLQQRCR
jgi:hypothetical protein